MGHRWYAPDEPWPEHDKQWWAEALREARDAGWHLRTFAGHTWGKVVCDRDAPDAHQMLIFSTGRGGENAARQLQKLMLRCRHTRAQATDDGGLERAGRLLDGAARLLDAAELLVTATGKRVQAEELLSLAEQELTRLDDADALLDEAAQLDSDSSDAEQRAAELTASAGYSPKRPFTQVAITAEAERRVAQAERGTTAHVIAERARNLRLRLNDIRARL